MAKISSTNNGLESHIVELFVPEEILESFELKQIIENDKELLFDMEEKEGCIPTALSGKEVVLNGYMNPTTLQSFPIKGKQCYIHLRRRRWKEKGSKDNNSVHNNYEYTAKGTLATKTFGVFLKRNSLISTPSRTAQSL